ncbi:hypothetical protein LINGRAHAP2_LOCUS31055, partial [Linum grandiflorum]
WRRRRRVLLSFSLSRRSDDRRRFPLPLGGQQRSRRPLHLFSPAVATRPTATTTTASTLSTSGVGCFSKVGGMKASGGTEAKLMIVAAG